MARAESRVGVSGGSVSTLSKMSTSITILEVVMTFSGRARKQGQTCAQLSSMQQGTSTVTVEHGTLMCMLMSIR